MILTLMEIKYFHRFTNITSDSVIFVGRLSLAVSLRALSECLPPPLHHLQYDNSVAEINYQSRLHLV